MQLNSKNVLNNFIGNKTASVSLIKSLNKSNCTGAWILRGPKGKGKAKLAENIIKAGKSFLSQPMEKPFIPSWQRVEYAAPGFLTKLRRAVVEDNK